MTEVLFDIIMISLMIISGLICIYIHIIYLIRFNKFTDYLFKIKDLDTLVKIGRSSSDGQKRFASVPFPVVHKKLQNKYEETGNIEYYLFDKFYIKSIKYSSCFFITTFLLYVIYQIVKYGVGW